MQWKEVFVFPLRRPGILLKLWVMHLLPLLAMIPFFLSGALTMVGAAVASERHNLDVAVAALGAGTLATYVVFVAVALFCGLYPLGYLLETARAVAAGECEKPLPLGRWLPRCAKGLYGLLLTYPAAILGMMLPGAVFLTGAAGLTYLGQGHSDLQSALGVLGMVAFAMVTVVVLPMSICGLWMRLVRSLNPFYALNPVGVWADFWRGWKDYLAMLATSICIYLVFCSLTLVLMLAAPFFLGGPLLLIPGILVGLAQNYFLLATANAGGQYARLYLR